MDTARELLGGIIANFADRAPRAIDRLINEEIRRRERVIGIFPNDDSAVRLLGTVPIERDEDWPTGRRHLNMAEYWQLKQACESG